MPSDPHIEHFYIKLDGQEASSEIMNALTAVEVDFSVCLPTMFFMILHNPDGRWLDGDTFNEGKKVEISAKGEKGPVLLSVGKISALEPNYTGGEQTLTVRGYDLSFGLYRNKHRRSYVQMTDSDIARRIAQDVGLQADVESTQQVHDYVLQNNQTHVEFLRERSRILGYELLVEKDTLVFRSPPSKPNGTPISLEWGADFDDFRPRLSVSEQVDEVTVTGWDPSQKSEILGRATQGEGAPDIGETRCGGSVANQVWGRASIQITDHAVANQTHAEQLAQAILNEKTSNFITAEGSCRGNPEIRISSTLRIRGVSDRFAGKYYVTSCNHRMTRKEGYVTRFSVSSRSPRSILETLRGPQPDKRHYGVCIGIVTNNDDPDGMGRIKVKFPWLENSLESNWARIASPMAGNERGTFWLPEVNDEVLVAFEQGNVNRPYVLGSLWNGRDRPPAAPGEVLSTSGQVQKLIWKSRSGHTIILDDSDSGAGISICDSSGNKVTIDSMQNNMNLSAAGDIAIEAKGKVTIKGSAGVDVQGSPGQVNVKGTTVNLN